MTCIVVLGCFRSGTSAVAGALHHLGVFMGEEFDPPNSNNPKGFWEDMEFKRIHRSFESCQHDSYDKGTETFANYSALIHKREQNHTLWGVKDPLLCHYFSDLLLCLKETPKVIVCRRSVIDIAESMNKSTKGVLLTSMFEPIASHYVECMDEQLKAFDGEVLEVHKKDPMIDILDPICEFVGVKKTPEAIEFLGGNTNHYPGNTPDGSNIVNGEWNGNPPDCGMW